MDAKELTKVVNELEDRIIKLEKENKLREQQIQKLQLHLGDHLCMNLMDSEVSK